MIELYHHGSSVCAAKVRFVLESKRIPWEGHYIDILKGEQFTPEYLELNPRGVVPTLVSEGRVVRESTVMCEFLEDKFPEISLMPRDPLERAEVRLWMKVVDEELHPACGAVTFMISHRHTIAKLGPKGLEDFLNSTPDQSVTPEWRAQKREFVVHGLAAPGAAEKLGMYYRHLRRMDEALKSSEWLVGDTFSLADISLAPYVNRLAAMNLSGLWTDGKLPRLESWFERIKAKHGFKPAFVDWMPDQLASELAENGKKSWPEVARLLNIG